MRSQLSHADLFKRKPKVNVNQFFKFLLVGMANTVIGYTVIFGAMYLIGLSPEVSNLAGFSFGLIVSYLLNRNYTFKSLQSQRTEFIRFVLVFLIAYAANFLVLVALVRWWGVHSGLSQILAGVIYVGTSYLLNKNYVFRPTQRN